MNKGQKLVGVFPGLADVVRGEFQRSRCHLAGIILTSGVQHVRAEHLDGLHHLACGSLHDAVHATPVTPVVVVQSRRRLVEGVDFVAAVGVGKLGSPLKTPAQDT